MYILVCLNPKPTWSPTNRYRLPMTTETIPPVSSVPSVPPRKPLTASRRLGRLLIALVTLWAIAVSFAVQIGAWVGTAMDNPGMLGDWVRATWLLAGLLALPILPLSIVWRTPRHRAVFQTWLWAIGYLALMAPTRLLPPVESQLLLLLQLAVTIIYLWVAQRYAAKPPPPGANARLIALAVGLLFALPWVATGALGSWLDILLAALLAAAWGTLAWTLLNIHWLPALRVDAHGPRRDRLSGGLVAGIMLLILAGGLSLNGVQLWLMVVLPATAWAATATGAPGLVWAIAVAAPLLLIDSDVTTLITSDSLLMDYLGAAALAVLLAWIVNLLGILSRATFHRLAPRAVAAGLAVLALVLAAAVYFGLGTTGFYGDRLFVVLTPQADVSGAAQLLDAATRRQAVHTTLVAHARATQSDLTAVFDRLGIDYTPYYLVNALEVQGGLLMRLWLQTRPEVDRILMSPELRPADSALQTATGTENAPTEPPWNLTLIGADRVWADFDVRGQSVIVGQSDSGVDVAHPALAGSYLGRTAGNNPGSDYHWFDPWYGTAAPVDYGGHGTHTLGTILGEDVGVAPDAEWIACANLVRNLGNPAKYLDCMQFMLAPFPLGGDPFEDSDPSRGANVLNNSWGCPFDQEGCDAEVFAPAVAALRTAGVYVVASAGNEGPRCATIADPIATYDDVTTVGAVDRAGNLAPFSSVGPVLVDGSRRIKPDLVAPGVDILSAYPNQSYSLASGTSMAGPHVAGVVALMWSANPSLVGNVAATEELLLEATRPFTGTLAPPLSQEELDQLQSTFGTDSLVSRMLTPIADPQACVFQTDLSARPNNVAGYGLVDAYRAVELARNAQP